MARNNDNLHRVGKVTINEFAAMIGVSRAFAKRLALKHVDYVVTPGGREVHLSAASIVKFCRENGYPTQKLLLEYADNYDRHFKNKFEPIMVDCRQNDDTDKFAQ